MLNETPEQSEQTEEEVIEQILRSAEFMQTESGELVRLTYGTKELKIFSNLKNFSLGTYVANIKSADSKKQNETTLLYKAGRRRIMIQIAQKHGHDFRYLVLTSSETMNNWVRTKGTEIFNFTPIGDDYMSQAKYKYIALIPAS